uniref:Cytochrome c oxidase subunit 3 n=1 Tax=Lycostomus sp. YXY-2021 TaxID=2806917 RepID=A0A888YLJ6_9COLE|nr:cytochrome c oxidase subunit III [Lycostomus sp. YXY-2021]
MSNKNHPFHLVELSPWPILSAFTALSMMAGMISMFHLLDPTLMFCSMTILGLNMFQWWRDITRESTFQGLHTKKVVNGLKWGMILFITSEVLFFVSFFWGYFHSSLSPSIEIGLAWPPQGIITFNPTEIPLLNTIILISSGISVTWAHHSLMENNLKQAIYSLMITVALGLYFTMLQGFEYMESSFTIADSVYGSTFFMATGFHGIHVIIGTSFLMIILYRTYLNHFSSSHHFGFEAAAWYWHFVDVVWLFLYLSIYWWGK